MCLLLISYNDDCDYLLRPPDVCRKVFTAVLISTFPDGRETPRQKYVRGLVLGWTRKTDSDISPIFKAGGGVKSAQFGLVLAFEAL